MMTVKELSKLTGISVRTLHYYDEIGLFKPTGKSEAGYRLYDDKALETLQQILFFREFDVPLKEIKNIMENPSLDRNQILRMQKKMLVVKKNRMERLIASIDDILKGDQQMDFTVFNKTELEEMFENMFEHMPDNIRQTAVEEFGGVEQWRKHYIEAFSSEDMQKNIAKVVEWYGGKEAYQTAAKHPVTKEIAESCEARLDAIFRKLSSRRDYPVDSFEIKEIIGEYGFVMKQFSQIKKEKEWMLSLAQSYRNESVMKSNFDERYGEGSAAFLASAIENFYR